ncbi:hypothetical protein OCS_00003 [Ophiocordyceps sinensis CO18]|nr:hypothetical protein OCS_00003 [Ophiocordyceps sinensis CO18]
MYRTFELVFDLWYYGKGQLAGMAARKAFYALELLATNHPLLKILQQLTRLLGQLIGSLAPQHLWLYEQLIWDGRARLRQGSALAQRREAMTTALHELSGKQVPDTGDGEYEKLRIDALVLEYTQMDPGDLQRAEELATRLLARTASDASARSKARFHAYARKMLARQQQEKSDWARAEDNLRLAIAKREAAHGAESDLRVIRDMWVPAAHFQKAGRQGHGEGGAVSAGRPGRGRGHG